MRFLELELERIRALPGAAGRIRGFCVPAEGRLLLLEAPERDAPVLTLHGPDGIPAVLPSLEPGFRAAHLADDGEGRVMAAGAGVPHDAFLLRPDGTVLRRYKFGEGIADLTFDPDGNLVLLRPVRRGVQPLLERYGPEGDPVAGDPQIRAIMGHTERREGTIVLVQNNGVLWLNLAEKYDADGALLDVIEPAEVFGPGRVSADLFGGDGIVALTEAGDLVALGALGRRGKFRWPEGPVREALGRRPSAASDVIATRGERLILVATDRRMALEFRMMWE